MTTARYRKFSLKLCAAAGSAVKPEAPAAVKKGAPAKAMHLLHVSAVKLEGSGWTDQRVLNVLRSAGRILARCGVKLERVELTNLAVPPGYVDVSTPVSRALVRDYRVARPAVYFVPDSRISSTFQAEAFGRGNTKSRPELADTVWITASARDPGIALAHELAHVLMDSGEHSEAPGNLMRDQTTPKNTALMPAQCERLRDTAAGNGLLKKAN